MADEIISNETAAGDNAALAELKKIHEAGGNALKPIAEWLPDTLHGPNYHREVRLPANRRKSIKSRRVVALADEFRVVCAFHAGHKTPNAVIAYLGVNNCPSRATIKRHLAILKDHAAKTQP